MTRFSALLALFLSVPAFAEPTFEVSRQNGIEFAKPDGILLLLDLYLPAGVENPPLIVWIHGGGWKGGSRSGNKMAWVAKHGYAMASIEYRLSQEAIFPAQIHDCKGAVRWLRANAKKYGYNADKIVVGGSSAGGHLVALMGTSADVDELEGTTGGNAEQSSRIQGVVDYYGPTDFVVRSQNQPAKTEQKGGGVFHLLGGKATQNIELAKLASPITHITKDDPPFLILHGAKDKTVYLDQSELFHAAYEKAGLKSKLIINPNGAHGWKPILDEERAAILEILKSVLK